MRKNVFYSECVRKILRAGEIQVASICKNHRRIKHAAHFVSHLAVITQLHSSFDSSIARMDVAKECIKSTSAIVRAVNTPLYTQLGNNFDCIHDNLENAVQEIIAWRNELYLRHPELPYPEFDAFLIESGNSVTNLLAQPYTRVLINVSDASDVETSIEHMYIVKNYAPFNFANYVNLKTIAMFDGVMTDALRTAIQNLAKQQNKLERIIIPSWGPNIANYAFQNCTALTTVDFPLVTSIGNEAFSGCISILDVRLPKITSVPDRAFKNCTALTSADCPLVTSIGFDGFCGTALENCKFGLLTFLGQGAFLGTKLVSLSGLALITSLRPWCFNLCF
ncbi:MAG: leucine-rich repeat domain-containing protein, partial [Holosporales bacterium]|nr:leucine-rich repeat domain-containing protein [Holosporales bacterium]